jgi:hypothetical protein
MSEVVIQTTGGARLVITPQAPRPIVIRRPGDMLGAVYDPQGIRADAFARANHTGTQTLATISDAGNSAGLDVGTIAGTVAAGDHTHAGLLWGLTLRNNTTDAANDLDIAAGVAADETGAIMMKLASGLTKRLDANWAAGTNQGGRYSGAAIANTTYHVWLVSKAAGADVEVYLDPSADRATVIGHLQAETGGASYLYARRIGSIMRASGLIVPFRQIGDTFLRLTPVADRNSTAAVTNTLLTLSLPTGINVTPILRQLVAGNAALDISIFIGGGDEATASLDWIRHAFTTAATTLIYYWSPPLLRTNTSGQIRFTQTNGTGAPTFSQTFTHGWIDTRGRLY